MVRRGGGGGNYKLLMGAMLSCGAAEEGGLRGRDSSATGRRDTHTRAQHKREYIRKLCVHNVYTHTHTFTHARRRRKAGGEMQRAAPGLG